MSQHPPNLATAHEVVLVLDFGSQTAQLIARRIRDAGVYAVLVRPDIPAGELAGMSPKGIVLSGGPASVFEADAPEIDPEILDLGVPVLGICYGMQLACKHLGATIRPARHREFGRAPLQILDPSDIFSSVPDNTTAWMSHADQISDLASAGLVTIASTKTCPHAAVRDRDRGFWGLQFHPEVTHTPHGGDPAKLPLRRLPMRRHMEDDLVRPRAGRAD